MDAIRAKIKAYVLILDNTITNNAFLDLIVQNVVNRALVYMNRTILLKQYEEDVDDYPQYLDGDGLPDLTEDFWYKYDLPIPLELLDSLALVVISGFKSTNNIADATTGAVKKVKDQNQEVEFSEGITNYFSSKTDQQIFSGISVLLDKYVLANVIGNEYSDSIYNRNRDGIL